MDHSHAELSPPLLVEKLSKAYGGKPVLKNISFSLQDGEIALLLGKNGAGKSTLLQILAGIQPQEKGRFQFRESGIAEHLGYCAHERMMYEDLSLEENLRVFFSLRGKEIPKEKLSLWGIQDLSKHAVRTLSQGQAARAGLFRALYAGSRFLLLDEPTAALDRETCALFCAEIKELLAQQSVVGAIIVTHNAEELSPLAARELHIAEGQLFESYTKKTLEREVCP